MEPLKIRMTTAEYKQRMKEIKEEEERLLEEERIANEEFLKQSMSSKSTVKGN